MCVEYFCLRMTWTVMSLPSCHGSWNTLYILWWPCLSLSVWDSCSLSLYLEICSHDSRQITIHVFSQVVENRGNTCYYPQQHCHHTLNALLEHPISFIQINFIYTWFIIMCNLLMNKSCIILFLKKKSIFITNNTKWLLKGDNKCLNAISHFFIPQSPTSTTKAGKNVLLTIIIGPLNWLSPLYSAWKWSKCNKAKSRFQQQD